MIYIYLCEDEEVQLSYFERVIRKYIMDSGKCAEVISARTSPEQILGDAKERKGDISLFFIDIQLDGYSLDGFGLARELKRQMKDCHLVFLTSREELAYKAFEYELGILDYIVKRPEDFLEDEVSDGIKRRLDSIFDKLEDKKERRKRAVISIECGSRLVEVDKRNIIFIQSLKGKHQTEIYTDSQRLTTKQTLSGMKERLGEDFIYVNKTCIVQRDKIKEIDRKNRFLLLEGGYQAEVSFRRLNPLLMELEGR